MGWVHTELLIFRMVEFVKLQLIVDFPRVRFPLYKSLGGFATWLLTRLRSRLWQVLPEIIFIVAIRYSTKRM